MTHLFLINPAAGSRDRTEMYSQQIHKICREKGLDYRIAVSACPGDCTRLTREAAESGKDYRIYACGGDGTLNEVAQGAAGYDNVAVTVFSGGSGNDFVKIFDDPKAFYDLERLTDAEETCFNLIDCNGDLSLNICSVGLDARIGTDVSRYKRWPLLQGFWAYAASTLVNVIRGVAEHYVVEINGEVFDGKWTMICVCNGRYYGGGFNPIPDADPTDDTLDVLVVKKVSRLQIAGVVGKYKAGRYKELGHLVHYRRTKQVVIHCDKETPVNLDGELRKATHVTMQVSQKKVRFFYPKGLTWQHKCLEKIK